MDAHGGRAERNQCRRVGDGLQEVVNRNLLCYLQYGKVDEHVTGDLQDAGWNLLIAENQEMAYRLARSNDIHVAVIFIDNDALGDHIGEIEQSITFIGQPAWNTIWFALLKDRRRMSDEVCALVADYCHDFFTPPYDSKLIVETLGHAAGMAAISRRRMGGWNKTNTFHEMVGESPSMRKLFRQIEKVSHSDAPVLLTGESGTGKELTARAIHSLSRRSDGPFIAVNCAALPASLIQSELFGYERGAFTGANKSHAGRFEAAEGGTIFLDEISDMPVDLQVNLLRFLEDKVIERLGGHKKTVVDARVICATHDDLEQCVQQGSFRDDLYYRLNVLPLALPSLRDRQADIELLANYMLGIFADESGGHGSKGFSKSALQAMSTYSWPGNVRELINRVRRAIVMSENSLISPVDLGLEEFVDPMESQASLEKVRDRADRKAIEKALRGAHNNISRAARELGISRTTLYRMMNRFDVHI